MDIERPEDQDWSPDLTERTRQALDDAATAGDAERLRVLENLYDELELELERDVGEAPSTRR
jgi:hypothetical protein